MTLTPSEDEDIVIPFGPETDIVGLLSTLLYPLMDDEDGNDE